MDPNAFWTDYDGRICRNWNRIRNKTKPSCSINPKKSSCIPLSLFIPHNYLGRWRKTPGPRNIDSLSTAFLPEFDFGTGVTSSKMSRYVTRSVCRKLHDWTFCTSGVCGIAARRFVFCVRLLLNMLQSVIFVLWCGCGCLLISHGKRCFIVYFRVRNWYEMIAGSLITYGFHLFRELERFSLNPTWSV